MGSLFATKPVGWTLIFLLSMMVGVLDWQTGHELSLFVFYFIPVGLAGWHLGILAVLIESVICGGLWFLSDSLAGHLYSAHFYSVWNTMIRLAAFVAIGWAIARIHGILNSEQEKSEALGRSLAEIKILEGLLPICAQCKKIRDKEGHWHQLERYITGHTNVEFTHGLCQDCAVALLEDAGLSEPKR